MANIGYARCSTLAQDLTAQRQALAALGVPADRVYLDEGLADASQRPARPRPVPLAAVPRRATPLPSPELDRLARSVPDALDILGRLSARSVRFTLGGSVYDWNDPFARMFLQILAVIAEFEARKPDPPAHPRRHGHRPPEQQAPRQAAPASGPAQDREIRRMHDDDDHNVAEIAPLFSVSRPTVYRSLERTAALPRLPVDTRLEPNIAKYDQLLTRPR